MKKIKWETRNDFYDNYLAGFVGKLPVFKFFRRSDIKFSSSNKNHYRLTSELFGKYWDCKDEAEAKKIANKHLDMIRKELR